MSDFPLPFSEMAYVPLWEAVLRLALSAVFATMVGLERTVKGKPLDVRPFVLVALGACLAVLTTMEIAVSASQKDQIVIDPAKVISGILGGIGFLGAGAIFRDSGGTHGAATGALVWMTGALGVACGLGAYPLALAVAILALATLIIGGRVREATRDVEEERMREHRKNGGEPEAQGEGQ